MLLTLLASLPPNIDLSFNILDLSKRPDLFTDKELLSKILLPISRNHLKVLTLDLSILSIAVVDQILENSNCS